MIVKQSEIIVSEEKKYFVRKITKKFVRLENPDGGKIILKTGDSLTVNWEFKIKTE